MPLGEPQTISPTTRPTISDVEEGPLGREFTVTFAVGQVLPAHQNSARVVITVTKGNGVIRLGEDGPQQLREGDVVRIERKMLHALEAPTEPMQVHVTMVTACCDCC